MFKITQDTIKGFTLAEILNYGGYERNRSQEKGFFHGEQSRTS